MTFSKHRVNMLSGLESTAYLPTDRLNEMITCDVPSRLLGAREVVVTTRRKQQFKSKIY